jgi:poly(glycerol-phosphate) alpha-glucosyltransferase
VLEAWAYSVPVMMTPQCNLPEGFSEGAALEIQSEPESIARGLRTLFAMNDMELSSMAKQGRKLVENRFAWPRIAGEIQRVYQWVLGRGPKPDSVITD